MADYAYNGGWNKVMPAKRPRTTHYDHGQTPQIFFNPPRVPLPTPSYSTDIMKPDYLTNSNGFYGSFYTGFRPPLMGQNTSVANFRGGSARTFPRKGSLNRINSLQRPRKLPMKEKKYSVVGKTAAMVLNELYPDFKEQCAYETIKTATKIPRFKCTFTVCGKSYSAEGSSKKIAKQLACEVALKQLRPDIVLEGQSFEKAEEEKMNALAEQTGKSLKQEKKKPEITKTSNYFYEYFLRLCREKEVSTGEKFQPIFECCQLPCVSSKSNIKNYLCSLILHEQGKRYTKESSNKVAGQNCVVKQALVDLFKLNSNELRNVERSAISLRPGPPMQVLLQALSFYDRSVHIDTETADEKPVEANSRFVAKCVLDNEKIIIGPPEESKQKAKDALCMKIITTELGLEMPLDAGVTLKRSPAVLSPCYALHTLMIKQYRNPHPDIVYSDGVDISEGMNKGPLFKCAVTINQKEVFEGTGQSKKSAKSAAAEKALKEFFKFDIHSEGAIEVLSSKRQKSDGIAELCNEICTLVRNEYESICQQQGCPITTHIAAFVIVKPDGKKTMVALGAGRNAIIDGRALKSSQGSLLLHMQCAVLARRAFLLYLHKQLEKCDGSDSLFEKSESGKYRLKPDHKVVLYTAFPPNITRATSEPQRLCCYYGNGGHVDVTPDRNQTFEEITNSGCLNVMSIADKMLKWNHLGVQGALLSYIVEPIFIENYFVGVPSNDRVVANTVLLRFHDGRKDEFLVKSGHFSIRAHGEIYHDWVADIGMLERLDPSTGRTVSGAPSRLSKSELFESWNRLLTVIGGSEKRLQWTCAEAKQAETIYGSAVTAFHEQLKNLGFGVWQRKNRCVDNFTLASFDC